MIGVSGPDGERCSRAECSAEASWSVNWRNPRIHSPDRVKVWLACADHVTFLNDYLSSRGFPVVMSRLGEPVDRIPDGPTS